LLCTEVTPRGGRVDRSGFIRPVSARGRVRGLPVATSLWTFVTTREVWGSTGEGGQRDAVGDLTPTQTAAGIEFALGRRRVELPVAAGGGDVDHLGHRRQLLGAPTDRGQVHSGGGSRDAKHRKMLLINPHHP